MYNFQGINYTDDKQEAINLRWICFSFDVFFNGEKCGERKIYCEDIGHFAQLLCNFNSVMDGKYIYKQKLFLLLLHLHCIM